MRPLIAAAVALLAAIWWPAAAASSETYTVRPGDTLFAIARSFETTVAELLRLNPRIEDPDLIFLGQRLVVPGERSVTVAPGSAPPGAKVEVTASGFPDDAPVVIGVGPPRSEFEVVARARTNENGELEATAAVPEHADPRDRLVFVVQTRDHRVEAKSDVFTVAAPDERPESEAGSVTVTGVLTDEGVECQALRGDDGGLYTIAGDVEGFDVGDRVRVRGEVAEMSFCMQGTTLTVERIERR